MPAFGHAGSLPIRQLYQIQPSNQFEFSGLKTKRIFYFNVSGRRFSIVEIEEWNKLMDTRISKVDCNSDILQEILVRLPPKAVFKCRSVSKRWNKLVSDPYFIKSYSEKKRMNKGKGRRYYGGFLGFVQSTKWFSYRGCKRRPWEPTHRFLSIINGDAAAINIQNFNSSLCFPEKLGYFISSSNGLILCGRHPRTYHIVNPITKRWVSLPLPKNNFGPTAAGLSCEEESNDLAVRYKVVRAAIHIMAVVDRTLVIETYSSETREWKESTLTAPRNFALVPSESPLVNRGIFYWWAACCSIAVYDSNKQVGEGENHIQLIELPTFDIGETGGRLGSFWGSDDGRLWMSGSTPMKLKIWVLPKDEYGNKSSWSAKDWILLHEVISDTLTKYYPPISENGHGQRGKFSGRAHLNQDIIHSNQCVVLAAVISWDPILLLLRRGESLCLYNLETKSMEPVRFRGRPLADYEYWNPYYEPVSLSSYALGSNLK
ncbi:hypothetical protein LguiB_015334 [Lonicera macranthoides]